ncbi:MAG: family 20 glycosylhydrolase [Fimbriimonadaceae bacterium]|nr:family 20 glycosylhydrolase [Fimbriimonadaceae bacterium]
MIACLAALTFSQATAARDLPLLPQPKSVIQRQGEGLILAKDVPLNFSDKTLAPYVQAFMQDSTDAGRCSWKLVQNPKDAALTLKIDRTLPTAYRIESGEKIEIVGRDPQALAWGMTTLLQMIDVKTMNPNSQQSHVPSVTIRDTPDSEYRGVLVDVARKYHSIDTLKQIVLMCRWYKINYLQLHLTDDQAFTFPSKAFPKLNSSNQHGGPTYSEAELKELVAYADARGVTIIPEFDIPGHTAAMIRTMPELFKIFGTKPYEHHSTLNFANEKVLNAVDTLIGEMCEVFKSSPYFHIGGDEADYSNAHQHADFQAAFLKHGLSGNASHEIFRLFLTQANEMVKKRGKKMIVWEGFGRNKSSKFPIPKDVTIMEFESAYYLPTDLLDDGYTVINAAWTPLYVVNKHVWPPKKVFDWDLRKFGRHTTFYPAATWFEVPTYERIIGGQVCAWEQPEYLVFDHLRRVVPAMAERTWNQNPKITYEQFETRLTETDKALHILAAGPVFKVSGLMQNGPDDYDIARFEDSIEVRLQADSRNLTIRYTTDGKRPTPDSLVYSKPIMIDKTTTIRAIFTSLNGKKLAALRESTRTFYKDVSGKPNLATGKPVTVSGGTQGPQVPEFAVDNNLNLGSSWWASPSPQWLQVDLQKVYSIDKIDVFPYWDGRRYYRYTVEVSADGKAWTKVVDKSENSVPVSASGDEHTISPVSARYVKVNMLSNSANEGVHLVELRVWGR